MAHAEKSMAHDQGADEESPPADTKSWGSRHSAAQAALMAHDLPSPLVAAVSP